MNMKSKLKEKFLGWKIPVFYLSRVELHRYIKKCFKCQHTERELYLD